MWVARKGVQTKLQELPIPFSDVRNIVEEFHLEDELTRSRCRAWLVLSSLKYLQADIIFPGCIVDCRIMIRPLSSEFWSFLSHFQTKICNKTLTNAILHPQLPHCAFVGTLSILRVQIIILFSYQSVDRLNVNPIIENETLATRYYVGTSMRKRP